MAISTANTKAFTASEALEAFRLVRLTAASGTAVEYCDNEDDPIGITVNEADNGSHVAVACFPLSGTCKVTAAGAFSIGDILYPAADGKLDDTLSGGKGLFKALVAATADGDVVEALYLPAQGGLVHSATANGTSVENTIAETAASTKTIKGAELQAGDVLEVIWQGWVEDNNSTDTLTATLKLGTETIITTGAVDVADNDIAFIHAFITIRSTGASASIAATGNYTIWAAEGTADSLPFHKAAATEDLSGDVELAVNFTWSVAHVDNEAESVNFIVIHHRQ